MALFAHNSDKINFEYPYDGVKTFSTVYTEMSTSSTAMIAVSGGSTIANEIGYPSDPSFGALIFIWKKSGWRGGAISIPLSGWPDGPICIAEIDGENIFSWKKLALKDDLAGCVPFAANLPSNQKFYMALTQTGGVNRIYFYSGEEPTGENAIGYITLT